MCGRARQSIGAAGGGYQPVRRAMTRLRGGNSWLDGEDTNTRDPEAGEEIVAMPATFFGNDNMHPGHTSLVMVYDSARDSLALTPSAWGIVPSGTTNAPLDPGTTKHFNANMFNARTEELAPTYRRLLNMGNRCVVALDGFYEWKEQSSLEAKISSKKQPYYISRGSRGPLLVAGLYSDVSPGGSSPTPFRCHALFTAQSCRDMRWLHHRMPVLLEGWGDAARWLLGGGRGGEGEALADLKRISTAATENVGEEWGLTIVPVSNKINKVGERVERPWEEVKIEKTVSVSSFFSKAPSPSSKDTGTSAFKSSVNPSKIAASSSSSSSSGSLLFASPQPKSKSSHPNEDVAEPAASASKKAKSEPNDEEASLRLALTLQRNFDKEDELISKLEASTSATIGAKVVKTSSSNNNNNKNNNSGGKGSIAKFFSTTRSSQK